jgi:hypothetical protein
MFSRNGAVPRACPRPDPFQAWPQILAHRVRQFICAVHGHEWLLRGEGNRLYLCCAWCDRETPGWTLDHPMMSLARSPVRRRIGGTAFGTLRPRPRVGGRLSVLCPRVRPWSFERNCRSDSPLAWELVLRLLRLVPCTRSVDGGTAGCRSKDSLDLPTPDGGRLGLKGAVAECAQPGSR